MDNLQTVQENELQPANSSILTEELTLQNRLEIIGEGIRKKYLSRLTEMEIAPVPDLLPLEEDLIDNVRVYHISEMVYQKGESALDKFATVYNTLLTFDATIFMIIDSDGKKTNIYLGVRNDEKDLSHKRSTVTLGDTLKNALIGHFPGIKIESINRKSITELSNHIASQQNLASVSVVGNVKNNKEQRQSNEEFVQGMEKLLLTMQGRQYIGLIIAKNKSPKEVEQLRSGYQELYTKLSPLQKVQFSDSESESSSRNRSFHDMDGKQKAAMIGSAAASMAGVIGGAVIGTAMGGTALTAVGSMIGGQIAGQFGGFINSLAPSENNSRSSSYSSSTTTENKAVSDMLKMIDENLKRADEFDSYGMWDVAGYFASDDMSAAEIAASNYRSLMNGDASGREVSAVNSWRRDAADQSGNFQDLMTSLSRFIHPDFFYGSDGEYRVLTNAATSISGKELGLHLGLPRATVPGLPVIEHAEFGKEVYTYQLFSRNRESRPEDRMTLGHVFDLGKITNKVVELDNKSLNMHTFITGSTGSGKSNTVYQMLAELRQDKIPFLVIEPAKGEYKDVFGHLKDVNVYSTNPNIAELININPFMFPPSIHVLEHIDGLVEIFSVCWPMYDAMSSFFKDAILKSYEAIGWDLGSSTFDSDEVEYPDFDVLSEQLSILIEKSDYADEIKSNYRGALLTRVRSLSVGLNKYIFTSHQTSYEKIFDENCILDISRVKSGETKALIMGLMVYILNEYRVDRKSASNLGLKHVTVLEEAHNLLKNTSSGRDSELTGKSVEMLTQTIAEIRTYGEGFIIVDQSPSSVDISAIKNTNTKIVLRTPEANDREAVGRSMGLTENQVNEIAKLPSGVAVVYQNDWVSPVLTMIDKADVMEIPYVNETRTVIKPVREARSDLICALMQPWINRSRIRAKTLNSSLRVIELDRKKKKIISGYLDDYLFLGGKLFWRVEDIPKLQNCLMEILQISDMDFKNIILGGNPDALRMLIKKKTAGFTDQEIEEICNVLTLSAGEDDHDSI